MSVQNITITAKSAANVSFARVAAAADDAIIFQIMNGTICQILKRSAAAGGGSNEITITPGTGYVVNLSGIETGALPSSGCTLDMTKVNGTEAQLFTGSVTVEGESVVPLPVDNEQKTLYRDYEFTEDTDFTIEGNTAVIVFGVACKSSTNANTVLIEPVNSSPIFENILDEDVTTKQWYSATTLSESSVYVAPISLASANFPLSISANNWGSGSVKVRVYYWREPEL
jgi:hypothetical protein